MFGEAIRDKITIITTPIARGIQTLGITPNMITLAGFAINAIAAYYLAKGHLISAGLLIIFAGTFDIMDGAVARTANLTSRAGALLDSVVDRYSEIAILTGALIYFFNIEQYALYGVCLVFASVSGSILVSYVRARSEGLRIECKVGFMQRPERIVLIVIGTLTQGFFEIKYPLIFANGALLLLVFFALAIATNITAIHRLVFSYYQLTER